MTRSTDRILTTHAGSLPRPEGLRALLRDLDRGDRPDADAFRTHVRSAVRDVVRSQREAGLDVVGDGEMSKVSYVTYVTERLSGFGGRGRVPPIGDARDFPEWARSVGFDDISEHLITPACVGEVSYADVEPLRLDIANLREAAADSGAADVFVTAASPGVISFFLENQHYRSHEEYVGAIAAAMRVEYEAIPAAGLVLQIDCPDLAMGRHNQFPDLPFDDWRRIALMHVEALNEATAAIPPDAMRIHICWGNYPGPHHLDVPLRDILDIVLRARPAAISIEAANPRHEHEWRVFQDVALPEDRVLIPGGIDTTTNYVEHPELIAHRIVNFARCVGRERVIAGTDCGFATAAQTAIVDPRIVDAKLRSLTEGAALASRELWGGHPVHEPIVLEP